MSDKVLCGECRWLRSDGDQAQWYYYCGLDKPGDVESWYERAGNERMHDRRDGSCDMGERKWGGTKELRELLDAEGIEWVDNAYTDKRRTVIEVGNNRINAVGNHRINADERNDGAIVVQFYSSLLSPKQATAVISSIVRHLREFEDE